MPKKALLIGVNKYKIPNADLRGCVNDVHNIEAALTKYFGFVSKDIKKLLDSQATTKNIEKGITDLLKKSKPGDVLYLHYSGHGANVPDADGDEADQRDEILCPTDLDWKAPITDDWLRKTIDELLPKEVNLTIVMDCCHSGTNSRALVNPTADVINRYLPNPWDMAAEESGRELTGSIHSPRGFAPRAVSRKKSATSRSKDLGTVDIALADMPEVLLTGCRDYQTSADALIEASYNGALTYYLVKAIESSQGKLTYRQVHQLVGKLVKAGGYNQVPQLEGRKESLDRTFLSPLK